MKMTRDDYLEYLSEDIGTEGLKDLFNSPDFGDKFMRSASSVLLSVLDSLASNLIVLCNNLRGYVIYKGSAEVMELVINKFDSMIEECTYNFDRLIQGFSRDDIEKGIEIFEAKTLTQKTAARIAINEGLKAIDDFHKRFEKESREWKEKTGGDIYVDPKAINAYTDSVRLQKNMINLQRKITKLSKKIRLSMANIRTLEKYGITPQYAEELLSVNRAEIAKMGSVVISAFSIIYVRPANGVKTTDQLNRIRKHDVDTNGGSFNTNQNIQSRDPHDDKVSIHPLNVATQMLNAVK